jgi:hypothetical protein
MLKYSSYQMKKALLLLVGKIFLSIFKMVGEISSAKNSCFQYCQQNIFEAEGSVLQLTQS